MPAWLNFLFAALTSQGWNWSRISQDQGWITKGQGLTVSLGLTAAFAIHQIFLVKKKPASRDLVRQRAGVVNELLGALLAEYYGHVQKMMGVREAAPAVRANVMLPVLDRFGARRRLQICYKACPPGVQYGRRELDLFWNKGEGVAGWVWKTGHAELRGIGAPNASEIDASIPQRNRNAISTVKSVYSVPILLDGKQVGVLNIDSPEDLNRTCFGTREVRALMEKYAGMLPSQCFESGVKI